jgi:homocysteine S-methyltransferase
MHIPELQQRLQSGQPVILDGAFGEMATIRGVETAFPLWATHALLSEPGRRVVSSIHTDYLKAGAHVISTGTFRAQERTFAAHIAKQGPINGESDAGLLSRRAILTAGQLAANARAIAWAETASRALVAGSHGPLEDCYTPGDTPDQRTLEAEHRVLAQNLADSGIDFLSIETIPTIREGIAAAQAAEAAGIPYGLSFWGDNGGVGHDESFQDAAREVDKHGLSPLYLGVNCVNLDVASTAVANLRNATDLPIAVSANGDGDPTRHHSWEYNRQHDLHYAEAAARWLDAGALLVGGCCGTTPHTIAALAKVVG